MKTSFNKYWIFIAICIIGNIFIFIFLSNKLENQIIKNIVESQKVTYE